MSEAEEERSADAQPGRFVAAQVDGGFGHLVGYDGKLVHLWLTRAFAPGAPVRAQLDHDAGRLIVEGRSIGSKRASYEPPQGDPVEGFHVRLRLVNASRELRRRLETLASTR